MRARYYNPELKRFMNRDVIAGSIENNQTLNRYAYTNGNPISFIDPFGLARETSKWSKWLRVSLDIAGATPFFGEVFDGVNAVWYLAEGDYVNAGISGAQMVPLAGNAVLAGKYAVKGVDAFTSSNKASVAKFDDLTGYFSTVSPVKKEDVNKNPIIENMYAQIPNSLVDPPTRRGNAPISKIDGKPIEIHHIKQKRYGPFVEMVNEHHRGKEFDLLHHPNQIESEIDRREFNNWRKQYWRQEWDKQRWK